jgi:3-oxoadipate enol-lactonase
VGRFSLERDGVKLSFVKLGQGRPIVLVQGLGLPASLWMRLPFGLAKSGYCVIAPDNRGAGHSGATPPPYDMQTLAADLAAIIEHVGCGPTLCLGMSLGGMIVQQLALDAPQLVSGIVLAGTTCGAPVGLPPSSKILSLMWSALCGKIPMNRIYRFFVHPETLARRPDIFREWERVFENDPAASPSEDGVTGQLAAAANHDVGARLGQIRCPAEVLTGAADRVIPPRNAEILREGLPDARLTIVERAGHVFPLEQPKHLPLAIHRLARRVDKQTQSEFEKRNRRLRPQNT